MRMSREIRMDQWRLCIVFRNICMDQWPLKFVKISSEFGAYRGLARGFWKSPSDPQNCRKKEKTLEKGTFIFCAKLWYAPNPGSKEI